MSRSWSTDSTCCPNVSSRYDPPQDEAPDPWKGKGTGKGKGKPFQGPYEKGKGKGKPSKGKEKGGKIVFKGGKMFKVKGNGKMVDKFLQLVPGIMWWWCRSCRKPKNISDACHLQHLLPRYLLERSSKQAVEGGRACVS